MWPVSSSTESSSTSGQRRGLGNVSSWRSWACLAGEQTCVPRLCPETGAAQIQQIHSGRTHASQLLGAYCPLNSLLENPNNFMNKDVIRLFLKERGLLKAKRAYKCR